MLEKGPIARMFTRKRNNGKKEDKFCDHCKTFGHVKETCFKLIGYPDWYVETKKNGKDKSSIHVNVVESSVDSDRVVESKQQEWLVDFIKQEVEKVIKGKQLKSDTAVNFVHNEEFAGMVNN